MAPKLKTLNHGRETYAVYYGDKFVLKRPLPNMTDAARDKWLAKQYATMDTINKIRTVGNSAYYVPEMVYINPDEYQILEERAPGMPLTRELHRALSVRQRFEIIDSLGAFLVDMNESMPIGDIQMHHISSELKFDRLIKFIETKMPIWFSKNEVRYISRIRDQIGTFEYPTRYAWSHCDLNSGNVFYDPQTSKLSFIDFAESGMQFIYRDIFAPLQVELEIYRPVYEKYVKLHDKTLWKMPGAKNDQLRQIMKYRLITVALKRFIKASDDLRSAPNGVKGENNNLLKIQFMREQMQIIHNLERQASK